jgi:hypothetical protein
MLTKMICIICIHIYIYNILHLANLHLIYPQELFRFAMGSQGSPLQHHGGGRRSQCRSCVLVRHRLLSEAGRVTHGGYRMSLM